MMKRSFRCLICSILVVFFAFCHSSKQVRQAEGANALPVHSFEIDSLVSGFMEKYNVPGLAIGISLDGTALFEKGYGYADSAGKTAVTPYSLFRIASVSKPVTAVTVLKLAEEGKLNLDLKVFGEDAVLGTKYGTPPYSAYLKNITIRHLLQHTAGGWRNDGNDPMFRNNSLTRDSLISRTINRNLLNVWPGTKYAYSNFGYCVLEAVIEQITGIEYEEYVKQKILRPMGIHYMQLGGNTKADRKRDEVTYYGQYGEDPYRYNISRMGAHGGWIADVSALIKFMARVDGFSNIPDILNPHSMEEMITPALKSSRYASGLQILKDGSWMHNGSLPGTGSALIRFSNGYTAIVLMNTRGRDGFFTDMEFLLRDVVKKVIEL